MIKRLLLSIAIATMVSLTAPAHAQSADSARQIKAGELVQLAEGLTLKVIPAAITPFAQLKIIKGQAVVVALELDSQKRATTIQYKVGGPPSSSDAYLMASAKRYSPRAVVEDFPSWGADNDKEIEALDPKSPYGTSIEFEGKGSIYLLFDLDSAAAAGPRRLSLAFRVSQPTDRQHSFVVSL